jgi:hypothetical protein
LPRVAVVDPQEAGEAGEGLPDDTIVVRGGVMSSATLDDALKKHARFYPDDPPSLSVAAHPGWDAETLQREARFIPHPVVRLSTVGELRALGHDVVQSGRPPHACLQLCAPGSDELYEDLRAAFSPAQPKAT